MTNELSLFSGAGGGLLGTSLLGWTPVGYVENNDYCQRVIAQRIKDGFLPNAPIFGDVQAFIGDGFAASYTGMVDVVTGGFPCQPFSNSGKRLGEHDPRNQWPATSECIRIIRPPFAFLENVPGLLTSGYFGTILGDLAESGYGVRWRILSAAELGAPHKRDRLWIVAYDQSLREGRLSIRPRGSRYAATDVERGGEIVADAGFLNARGLSIGAPKEESEFGIGGQDVSNSNSIRRNKMEQPHERRADSKRKLSEIMQCDSRVKWWEIEPGLGRVVDGVAHRVDRLKAIGNGQVPAVVATVWRLLTGDK